MSKWSLVEQALKRHRHEPDLVAARALYAAVCAHHLKGPLVWPMLVAPPGSGKTELLAGLREFPNAHEIDSLTPQTFITGYFDEGHGGLGSKRDKPIGLLHRIGESGVIVFSDFSTILALKHEAKAMILAQMRRIYDGTLRKEFGGPSDLTEREWKGRITFVAAVTPDIDRHYQSFQSLGERFVMIRWPRVGGVETAMAAMDQDTNAARNDLREAAAAVFQGLPELQPEVPEAVKQQIASIAEFAARARTHITRDTKKQIEYVPDAESPTRLAQQFIQLARGSALLDSARAVSLEDIGVVRRVAMDSLTENRRAVLSKAIFGTPFPKTIPASTLSYVVEDLVALDILQPSRAGKCSPVLADWVTRLLTTAGFNLQSPVAA